MKNNFNIFELIQFSWKNRKFLISVTVIALVVSVIVSFLITPMFKASSIVFPTNNISISASLDFQNQYGFNPLFKFGDDEDAEQLIQVLKSDVVTFNIVRKYNLMEHYEIDPSERYADWKLGKQYEENIKIKKTSYMSVQIEVMDKDPLIAANIANDIVAFGDTVANTIKWARAGKAYAVIKKSYDEQLAKLENTEKMLKGQGYDMKGLSLPVIKYYEEMTTLEKLKLRLDEAASETAGIVPYSYIVSKAYPADKKSYPKKSIIVIVSTIGAFIIALIFLLFRERMKEINIEE